MTSRTILGYLLGAVLILVSIGFCAGRVTAHDHRGHWLDAWGVKCCSDLHRECRPARSMLGDDGGYSVWLEGRWRPVPPTAVLATVESPDGSSYVCLDKSDGRIRCFINGKPKS